MIKVLTLRLTKLPIFTSSIHPLFFIFPFSFSEKKAKKMKVVIIGGSSGMGRGLALKHAAAKDDVMIVARSEADLAATQRACTAAGSPRAGVFRADVTRLAECNALLAHLGGPGAVVDVCYFAVGRGAHQVNGTAWTADDATTDVYTAMFSTNFFGPLNALRALLPALIRCKAHCVFLNSASGIVGLPGRAAYCASKAALTAACETLVAEGVPITMTEVFVVSVSGTNLRKNGIIAGMSGPAAHEEEGGGGGGGSSSEVPVEVAVEQIFAATAKRTRRLYIPAKLRVAPIVKHLPLIPSDTVLDKLVWAKARL